MQEQEQECHICMNDMVGKITFKCGHGVCRSCVKELYSTTNVVTCPYCRKYLVTDNQTVNRVLSNTIDRLKKDDTRLTDLIEANILFLKQRLDRSEITNSEYTSNIIWKLMELTSQDLIKKMINEETYLSMIDN